MSKKQSNPDPPENESLKENDELTIQIAKGPVLIGSEICICSIHDKTLQVYENYFRLKSKRKKGNWVLKKMGHLSELGKK